jgi:hypothetical protein
MFSPLWLTLFQSLCSLYCSLSSSVFVLTFVLSISSLAFCCSLPLFVSRVVLSVFTTVFFYCTLFLSHSCLAPFVFTSSLCTTPYCLFVFKCCLFLVFFLAPPFCLRSYRSYFLVWVLYIVLFYFVFLCSVYTISVVFPLAVCSYPPYFPPSRPTFVLI